MAAPLHALEELGSAKNGIGEQGAASIAAACYRMPKLRIFVGAANAFGDGGVRTLALAHFPQLESLDLRGCEIGAEGADAIAAASHQKPKLWALDLSMNALGDGGARALAQAHFPQLEWLFLRCCQIGPEGAAAIAAASPRLPKMRHLELFGNSLCSNGARALAQAHFPQLERLNLVGNSIGAAGKADLDAARLGWPKLSELLV